MSKTEVVEKFLDFAVKPGKCDVRLSEDEMSMLEKLCKQHDLTKSDIVRRALRAYYKIHKKE